VSYSDRYYFIKIKQICRYGYYLSEKDGTPACYTENVFFEKMMQSATGE